MKLKRTNLLTEPPAVATGDIAFILIVFFLVCASVQPDTGREQVLPKAETTADKSQQSKNIEVAIARTTLSVNGAPVPLDRLQARLAADLAAKTKPADRVVVVKSAKDVPYDRWIAITTQIQQAGGTITLQVEEQRTVVTN